MSYDLGHSFLCQYIILPIIARDSEPCRWKRYSLNPGARQVSEVVCLPIILVTQILRSDAFDRRRTESNLFHPDVLRMRHEPLVRVSKTITATPAYSSETHRAICVEPRQVSLHQMIACRCIRPLHCSDGSGQLGYRAVFAASHIDMRQHRLRLRPIGFAIE
jgi:hypothetical protein